MTKKRRVAVYARVSTDGQTTENQIRELKDVAERSGWHVVEVYEDNGISGSKGREQRPAFDRLLKAATARKFDMIAVWSVDRLGRSLQHLVTFLDEVHALGVELYLHQQGIDTTTPSGKAMFQMVGVFAEFERAMIRERVVAGLGRARDAGKVLGRRPGSMSKHVIQALPDIKKMQGEGRSIRYMAKETGLSVNTVLKLVHREAA